eukprot:2601113-Amphidinium_carterae.1
MRFVAAQLHSLKADFVFVQETRLPEHADMEQLDGFQIYTTPARSGHGGLMVLIRQDPIFLVDRYQSFGSRVMT